MQRLPTDTVHHRAIAAVIHQQLRAARLRRPEQARDPGELDGSAPVTGGRAPVA